MIATSRHRIDEPLRAVPLSLPSSTERKTAPRQITVATLDRWVERADPGDVIEYHRGHLATDRFPGQSALPPRQYQELGRIAERVAALAAQGRVALAQKRIDVERVAYLAIRTGGLPSRKPF